MAEGPSTCGCKSKCSAKITYFDETIQTSSPKIAAVIRMANRKNLKFSKTSQLVLWAQTTNLEPEIEDKIGAIYDFSICPNILGFAGNFENWKETVAKIRGDLKQIEENQKVFPIIVKILHEQILEVEFHVKQSDTVESLKLKIQNRHGMPTEIQKLICDGRHLNDDQTLGYYHVKTHSDIFVVRVADASIWQGKAPRKGAREENKYSNRRDFVWSRGDAPHNCVSL